MPSVLGRFPTTTGLDGSVTSTNEVPSMRPTSAYSRCVSGSVHPQMSLRRVPRSPPSALTGRYASKSTSLHPKMDASPFEQSSCPPTTGSNSSISVKTEAVLRQPPPSRSKIIAEPAA